ncbi:DNA-binding transcriptional response regulator, NtrC family, contains REC, AAA-type ATPase, and a Fis-type DNA-binding domains [Gulbenkiania indica]|uniref:DNA-binding transcriptional response regulator, NtrC family, contains REC, AAA-type ATPase, and a Fis-type DNA-binding domains n=3 Tax=Gulbenkiania TaxID=397456 RepID=A0A0K6GTY6_9NEIS|nr:sigma-54 dependent transcriptional regulator [Gulbenkiania indica]TCW33820.1 DNA-binding NtrC family response regulator [Gulbenkiania mobilis]CUA82191.1 DNA-binding transcriptional response regulator, NtrC family, contains REC, AAA-type ATPase, and a Fis-type DNA-binding domains [Gulbenkiania indica]
MAHALIVEDDADAAEMMAALIVSEGFTAATASSLRDAKRQLALQEPDIVLLDLMLPDGSGMELFDHPEILANTEVVLITGHASLETSIQALRLGAADYLLKPINIKQIQGILSRVTKPAKLKAEIDSLKDQLDREGKFGLLWGRSAAMQKVYAQIARVAGTAVTVLITGESGTGKEVVAQTIHELSRRRNRPFLAVNCGAISPQLIESEIFGHEKGSFTGANRQHQGFFERANGGTLFLDEVTEMPLELQVKLLRVLETGTFMRVGSSDLIETDVRVIAATNRSPEQAVANGKLREDLLYRLNVFPIQLPPLRERLDDVPLLAQHFLADICEREGTSKHFNQAALDRMSAYRWPGNVRQLRNAVQRAYVMAVGEEIDDEWLPSDTPAVKKENGQYLSVKVTSTLAEVEKTLILATLAHFGGHKEKTAAALGVSLKTLYNRLKEYAEAGDTDKEHMTSE